MIRLALAVVCLLGLGGFIYLTFRPADKRPVVKGYCPDCGMELPKGELAECPFCKLAAVAANAKKPNEAPRKSWQQVSIAGKIAIFAGICLLAAVVAAWDRLAKFRRRGLSEDGQFYHFRCCRCKRKLRYEISKVGRMGACPACNQRCIFPDPSAPDPSGKAVKDA
jgi:hypothetical protein